MSSKNVFDKTRNTVTLWNGRTVKFKTVDDAWAWIEKKSIHIDEYIEWEV
jgi:hypothetical protein